MSEAPSVRPVEWYDTLIPTSRCVTVQWWPNATEAGDDRPRLGRLYLASRSTPGEVWPAMVELGDTVTADEARTFAVSRGCVYRVTDSGVQRCRA
jgi:hypothetical protein